jgi:hypothetical protein
LRLRLLLVVAAAHEEEKIGKQAGEKRIRRESKIAIWPSQESLTCLLGGAGIDEDIPLVGHEGFLTLSYYNIRHILC